MTRAAPPAALAPLLVALLLPLVLPFGGPVLAQDEAALASAFSEEITVSLHTVTARIVDPSGVPARDIAAEDLVARVGGVEVAVTAVDYRAYGDRSFEKPDSFAAPARQAALTFIDRSRGSEPSGGAPLPPPLVRQLVILMQIGGHDVATLEGSYVRGHQRALPGLYELLDDLHTGDRVALLSYDVALKLWSDFTTDHSRIKDLLAQTIGFASPPPFSRASPPSPDGSSLARSLRPGQLEDATNPGKMLSLLAEALAAIDGPKDILYVGWDMGGQRGFASRLLHAETTVSVLDVTQADGHLLGGPLKAVATATGGTYEKIFRFPKRGPRRFARTLAGYHTITLDLEAARRQNPGEVTGRLRVEAPDRDVAVHLKAYFF